MTNMVADETLGKIAREQNDLFRRVREGTLDPEKISRGLQALIEGRFDGEQLLFLEPIGTVTIPATTDPFVAREKFAVGIGRTARVKISWLGDNFKEWFLGKTEGSSIQEITLRYAKLVKSSVDGSILAELGDKAETTLVQIWVLMELQPNGEEGALLTNGWANIFYVNGRAVYVGWNEDGWDLDASSVTDPGGWDGESRVFSRNS